MEPEKCCSFKLHKLNLRESEIQVMIGHVVHDYMKTGTSNFISAKEHQKVLFTL